MGLCAFGGSDFGAQVQHAVLQSSREHSEMYGAACMDSIARWGKRRLWHCLCCLCPTPAD